MIIVFNYWPSFRRCNALQTAIRCVSSQLSRSMRDSISLMTAFAPSEKPLT